MSHHCIRVTIRTTASGMNAGTMAFVRKENPEGTYSSFLFILFLNCLHSAFSLKIRLVLISASPIENHDVIIPNVTVFLAIVVLDSDENEENEESILPKKIRKVSKKSCSRRPLIYRLFTVPYFRVISSRSSAVRYGLPSFKMVAFNGETHYISTSNS